jgi:hypothetical protein
MDNLEVLQWTGTGQRIIDQEPDYAVAIENVPTVNRDSRRA